MPRPIQKLGLLVFLVTMPFTQVWAGCHLIALRILFIFRPIQTVPVSIKRTIIRVFILLILISVNSKFILFSTARTILQRVSTLVQHPKQR